jgi:hypothetical protein
MNKLELKHLAPYLPYGLKGNSKEQYFGVESWGCVPGHFTGLRGRRWHLPQHVSGLKLSIRT